MTFIREFSSGADDPNPLAIGNKALFLSQLCQSGFSVPKGFVVTTDAFDYFLRVNSIDITGSVSENVDGLRERIIQGTIPADLEGMIFEHFGALNNECVAVRSSATVEDSESYSFAGQFDSFLGVTKETLAAK